MCDRREMPRYKCHKEVHALRISGVGTNAQDGTAILHIADKGYADLVVSADYVKKHDPQPGGYYVVYADGYKSFSPAEAFENGYTRN